MPLALLVRLLSRVALLLGVVLLRRRGRGAVPVPPPYRTPGVGGGSGRVPPWLGALAGRTWLGRRMPDVVEGARLAGFALAFTAFGGVTLVLISAGTTLATLGPRWLGIVLLGLAVFFGVAAVREAIWLRRAVMLRRRRRWVRRLGTSGDEPYDR